MQSIKEKIKKINNKLTAIYLAYKRKDTPIIAKIMAIITIGYALSPIDLIPDFIPVIGYLDDFIILPILIVVCVKLIPKDIMMECEANAKNMWKDGKPEKWYYSIPIIITWLLIIGFIIYKIIY